MDNQIISFQGLSIVPYKQYVNSSNQQLALLSNLTGIYAKSSINMTLFHQKQVEKGLGIIIDLSELYI